MTHTHHMKVRFYCLTKRGNARNISFVKNGGNITLINLLGTKFWWIRIPSARNRHPNEFFYLSSLSYYNKIFFSFSLVRYVLVEFLVILMYFTCLQYLTTGLPNLKIKAIPLTQCCDMVHQTRTPYSRHSTFSPHTWHLAWHNGIQVYQKRKRVRRTGLSLQTPEWR